MLEFKKAEVNDKDDIERLLSATKKPSLEYNFTTFFIWAPIFGSEFAIEDDVLFIRSGGTVKNYFFPCGYGDIKKALLKIADEKIGFYSLTKEQAEILEEVFPERFEFWENRDGGDYVYSYDTLAELKGKKLSAKRNHINKFLAENHDWTYEKITTENLDEVKKMHKEWCSLFDMKKEKGLLEETVAVKCALDNFSELGLSGGLIRVKEKVCAFSVGDELNGDTFLVHIEKAYPEVSGAYQMINREFVRNNCKGYKLINREDDAGDLGLRRAKLSYRPEHIVEKYCAKEKIK